MSRKGKAPCGHTGTFVTNTFITCDLRCEFDENKPSDGVPAYVDLERTKPLCQHCGSADVEQYIGFNYQYSIWHCHSCGRATTV